MSKGWFVGAFNPTAHETNSCEVAIKSYSKGEKEPLHHHKIATEITVVLTGKVMMCGRTFSEGDIVVLAPDEATSFECLEDSTTVVVKLPGALNDKYLGEALPKGATTI